ncbi:hypothetical protein PTKIN_Ptkin04bG0015700 [Pterospermum kingtungense]
MAKPSVHQTQFLATIIASIKQEPLQSPPSQPTSEPIPPLLAVVKTEPQQNEQQQPPAEPPQQPQFLESINDLASLSSAVDAFKCRFDNLTKHLHFINQAIDSKFNDPQIEIHSPPRLTETDTKTDKTGPQTSSEVKSLCEMICGKGLRKYVVTHLSNVPKLREEVPAALKLAPNPAKLVLDCIGGFFLQGIKAYTKDSPMVPARQASIEVGLKVEAHEGAVAWRKRLIAEGGLAKASEVDARGLLLFVACFGIPKVFLSVDLGHLLRLCDLRAISDVLKGSPVLLDKMPDIIDAMAKNGMHVEAVDVASIFGLEDKCSSKTILTSFLQESTKAFKRAKQEAQNSPVPLRKANEKQLDALKSVVQCLEDRNNDVVKLLGSWQLEKKIVKLEEEIAELNKRIEDKKKMPKRKLEEIGSSSRVKSQEMKRSAKGPPLPKSSHVNELQEQRTATLAVDMRLYDGSVPNSYDSFISGHVTNYPAASAVPRRSTIGTLPENGVAQLVGINDVGSSSMVTNIGAISTSSYSGALARIEVDKAGQTTSSSDLQYGWQRGSVGQSASMRFGSLFGSSQSVEGIVGLPDTTDRTSADLYRFADSIRENESYSNISRRTGISSTVASVHHSSYMYR